MYSLELEFTIFCESMITEQEISGAILISPVSSASFLGAISVFICVSCGYANTNQSSF